MLEELAATMEIGEMLALLDAAEIRYQALDHWQQGEFHHDFLFRIEGAPPGLKLAEPVRPGTVLVVATNCNGGIKEILAFDEPPFRWALWRWRCPDLPQFQRPHVTPPPDIDDYVPPDDPIPELPEIRGRAETEHWFPAAQLLTDNARSEYSAEWRRPQLGGGWELADEPQTQQQA